MLVLIWSIGMSTLHSACVCVSGSCCKWSYSFEHILIQILLEHLTLVTQLLEEDNTSTTVSTFLPKSLVTVHNRGTSLPLHHPVTVEGSWPTAHCYLTCEADCWESAGVSPKTTQPTVAVSTLESNGASEHQSQGKEAGQHQC